MIIGPVTFLLLSKAVDGAGAPLERLDELLPLYAELLRPARRRRAPQWVQIDEPALVTDISADAPALAERVYNALGALRQAARDPRRHLLRRPRIRPCPRWPARPIEAIGVDLVYGPDTAVGVGARAGRQDAGGRRR